MSHWVCKSRHIIRGRAIGAVFGGAAGYKLTHELFDLYAFRDRQDFIIERARRANFIRGKMLERQQRQMPGAITTSYEEMARALYAAEDRGAHAIKTAYEYWLVKRANDDASRLYDASVVGGTRPYHNDLVCTSVPRR